MVRARLVATKGNYVALSSDNAEQLLCDNIISTFASNTVGFFMDVPVPIGCLLATFETVRALVLSRQ